MVDVLESEALKQVATHFYNRGVLLAYKVMDDRFAVLKSDDDSLAHIYQSPTYFYSKVNANDVSIEGYRKIQFLTSTYKKAFDQKAKKLNVTKMRFVDTDTLDTKHSLLYNAVTRNALLAGVLSELSTAESFEKTAYAEYMSLNQNMLS